MDSFTSKMLHFFKSQIVRIVILLIILITMWSSSSNAQDQKLDVAQNRSSSNISGEISETIDSKELLERIKQLEQKVNTLETELANQRNSTTLASVSKVENQISVPDQAILQQDTNSTSSLETTLQTVLSFFKDTTINLTSDVSYGYNFNRPVGRINLLRANDVMSNSFNLNQAILAIENKPNVEEGKRFGYRLDLHYGQSTETLQGSAANELRPQTYRPILQAYGTYVAPIGKGLTLDFGKWVSALGIEGIFTKDQMHFSRCYYFNFLPFYHTGLRANYAFNDKFNVTYWLVNGANQTEDFNGFKSQAILLNFKPNSKVSWNVNYYRGIEGRDSIPTLTTGFPNLPTQPGISTNIIRPVPRGKFHVIDTYVTWNISNKLMLASELDYVINRNEIYSPPSRVVGGTLHAKYQLTPKVALSARGEYLSDRGGLFSGINQALKETTLTYEYKFAEGLLTRFEWRRDFSNQLFFLTNVSGVLKKEQNTATLGFVWWFGGKQGSW